MINTIVTAVVLIGLAAWGWQSRWFERNAFFLKQDVAASAMGEGGHDCGAGISRLDRYVADIQALPVAGEANMSSITYDPQRRLLVSITNKDPHLIELTTDGFLQRRIALPGFSDPEAVEYLRPSTFMIAEERRRRLTEVTLTSTVNQISFGTGAQRHLTLGPEDTKSRGFEALAYDPSAQRLFVAKENDPVRIYQIDGFFDAKGQASNLEISLDTKRDRRLFLTDISGMVFDARTGNLLVLSDESKLVIEVDPRGHPVGAMSLKAGEHGLKKDIPQAEGIALDDDGNLYIVSEPNLFYRFRVWDGTR